MKSRTNRHTALAAMIAFGVAVALNVSAGAASAAVPMPAAVEGASSVSALRDGAHYRFLGVQSRKYLAVEGDSASLAEPGLASNELWTAVSVAGQSGAPARFLLQLPDGRTLIRDGSTVKLRQVADAATNPEAHWEPIASSDAVILRNASSGTVLDVAGQSSAVGAAVGLWDANGGANQLWSPIEVEADGTVIDRYVSFEADKAWFDESGSPIQAHGGQVVVSEDEQGRTIYYLYGEDHAFGYPDSPGVHGYSSYDLYNWKDEGVVLRALSSREQLDTDPYFAALYGDYDATQRASIYRDLVTTRTDPEVPAATIWRPKVIHNEATGKWVMWFHSSGPSETSNAIYAKARAGVAISDSPFGPFRYIDSYSLHHADPSDPTNRAPDDLGMSRDMNLFVDDDGTAYVIYASEHNQTMFISRLNDEYTYLSAPPESAVEGVDYKRIFVGWSREAPAMFKYDERYFLLTSGTRDWTPNPTQYATAASVLGDWTHLGDPFPGWAQHNSWNTQPTSVIPVDPEQGKFIYMGDRWNEAVDLRNAQMVWLPIEMGEGGDDLSVVPQDEWRLEDLDGYAVWRVSGVPTSVPVGTGFNPATVSVTQAGETSMQPVTWQIDGSFDDPGVVRVTGTLPGFGGRTFERAIAVVPSGTRFVVDAGVGLGAAASPDWNALVAAAGEDVRNGIPDQAFGVDPSTGESWGYIGATSGYEGAGDVFDSVRFANSGDDLAYRFADLDPGRYSVYAGYHDPWAQWSDRGAEVTINGEVVAEEESYSAAKRTVAYHDVVVGADGELSFSLSKTRADEVLLSWLIVTLDEPAAPVLNVTATAGTRCVGGKVYVTTSVLNGEDVPVDVTVRSEFGTKQLASVRPGRFGSHAFTTRLSTIGAGEIEITATAVIDGVAVETTLDSGYDGATCN